MLLRRPSYMSRMRPAATAALLSTMMLGNACKSRTETVRSQTLDDEDDATVATTQAIRMRRFRESEAPVVRTVINDSGEAGADFRTSVGNKEDEIFTTPALGRSANRQVRLALASLVKNDVSRDLAYRAALDAIRRRSAVLWNALASGDPINTKYDVIIIGAGPEAAIMAQRYTEAYPTHKVLIVDRKNKPGGVFADVGFAFLMNSTNRQNDGERATPGRGDLNTLADLLGMPDWESFKWPKAGSLGQLTTFLLDNSSVDVLLEADVTRQTDGGQTVSLKSAEGANRSLTLKTEWLVAMSGLGEPKAFLPPETRERLRNEKAVKATAQGPDTPASYEDFSEFADRFGRSKTPLRSYINKTGVVIGLGDSGKVTLQSLLRLGVDSGYGRDVAQVGNVGTIYVFANIATCEEYLNGDPQKIIQGTRSRYAVLFGAIASQQIKLVPGKVIDLREVEVEENGTRVKKQDVIYESALPSLKGRRFSSLNEGFFYADPKQRGVPTASRSVLSDKVAPEYTIGTVGFDPTGLTNLLLDRQGTLDELSPQLKDLAGPVEAFGGEIKRFGLRLENSRIIVAGPACDAVGKPLPDASELAKVNANTVSLFANGERTKAVVNYLGPQIGTPSTYTREVQDALYPVTSGKTVDVKGNSDATAGIGLSGKVGIYEVEYAPLANGELELRAELDRLSQFMRVDEGQEVTIEFTASEADRQAYKVNMTMKPAQQEQIEQLQRLALSDGGKRLAAILLDSFFTDGGRVSRVTVKVPAVGGTSTKLNANVANIQTERGARRAVVEKPTAPLKPSEQPSRPERPGVTAETPAEQGEVDTFRGRLENVILRINGIVQSTSRESAAEVRDAVFVSEVLKGSNYSVTRESIDRYFRDVDGRAQVIQEIRSAFADPARDLKFRREAVGSLINRIEQQWRFCCQQADRAGEYQTKLQGLIATFDTFELKENASVLKILDAVVAIDSVPKSTTGQVVAPRFVQALDVTYVQAAQTAIFAALDTATKEARDASRRGTLKPAGSPCSVLAELQKARARGKAAQGP